MISPYAVAREFNGLIREGSSSNNDFQSRLLYLEKAKVFYYCLTGVSLDIRPDLYFSAYDYKIDTSNLSQLEVDNTTGERLLSPIRRFIHFITGKE